MEKKARQVHEQHLQFNPEEPSIARLPGDGPPSQVPIPPVNSMRHLQESFGEASPLYFSPVISDSLSLDLAVDSSTNEAMPHDVVGDREQ